MGMSPILFPATRPSRPQRFNSSPCASWSLVNSTLRTVGRVFARLQNLCPRVASPAAARSRLLCAPINSSSCQIRESTMLGKISRRGNRYLRSLFVQAAWVVLVKIGPKHWDRYGLKSWIEAARKRLHHNVLAIALANKLARIAWAVLNKGRAFECVKTEETASRPA